MVEPEPEFDRQAFVSKRDRSREPSGSFVPLLFLVGIGLLGVAGFLYVRTNGIPALGASEPDLSQVIARLEGIEQRLAELEKRRSAASAKSADAPTENTPAIPAPPPSAESLGRTSGPPPAVSSRPEPPAPGAPAGERNLRELQKQYSGLRTDVTANREAWDASTERLGRVAGELGEQRNQLAESREKLGQLWSRFDRTPIAFELRKGAERQRVGPVWLQLRRSDRRNHRYTVRVFIDEKWIELRDRALLEPVEFYLTGSEIPLELVVTDIQNGGVAGSLAVPRNLSPR